MSKLLVIGVLMITIAVSSASYMYPVNNGLYGLSMGFDSRLYGGNLGLHAGNYGHNQWGFQKQHMSVINRGFNSVGLGRGFY